MRGESQVVELEGTLGETCRPTSESRYLRRQDIVRWRFELCGVARVPPCVESPDVAHDELGLVVDRSQIGPFEQMRGGLDVVDHLVQGCARVDHVERLLDE
jgi:hypothetical protein